MPVNVTTLDDPLRVFNGSSANGSIASGINNPGLIVGSPDSGSLLDRSDESKL